MKPVGGLGGFTVSPNPAQTNEPITVHGDPGATVHWQADGETESHTLALDENGEGTLQPPAAEGVTFTDNKLPRPHSVYVEIESTK